MASRPPPPIAVDIPSDDDDDDDVDAAFGSDSPLPPCRKRVEGRGSSPPPPQPPLLVLVDDDPTPQKMSHADRTPSFVPETPLTPPSGPSVVRCSLARSHRPEGSAAAQHSDRYAGISGLICLESEDEESGGGSVRRSPMGSTSGVITDGMNVVGCSTNALEMGVDAEGECVVSGGNGCSSFWNSTAFVQAVGESPLHGDIGSFDEDSVVYQPHMQCKHNEDNVTLEHSDGTKKSRGKRVADNAERRSRRDEQLAKKRQLKEERVSLNEERKRKRQEEKLAKEVMKAEAAEMKKLQKEKQKWEKGKLALKSIVAEIDTKVVENGSVGGHLLTRFAEKGLSFRITLNPVERSILWKMSVPNEISQLSLRGSEIQYILLVYEADEFCSLVTNGTLQDHVCRVQRRYPSFTICYLTNRLMSFINKREQSQYKNPANGNCWVRPPIEEVLSKLTTHFTGVHSRHCMDEADVADHIVGLTSSLATCQFRKKITRLSVNANGSLISKDFIDKHLIKKNVWLKALVAIPKVQPRFAIAIWKKYPTMRSLLNVYMDPTKSVHEKEFLLKDLAVEGLLGNEDRRLGEVCSKRVYRILMAQNGGMKTDDAELGADFFIPDCL